jgi:uncharacterized protein YndB with AHSA1/START domain
MTTPPFAHGTFTIERKWAAPPSRVFNAWADPALKAQWFTGPPRWTALRRSLDFRTGGLEVLEGRFSDSGSTTLYEARFHLIEPDRRLVYVYDLHHGGSFHSVTLASLFLEPVERGTRSVYTEQIVFLDGRDGTADRRHGTELQHAAIERILGSREAAQ